MFQGAGKRLFKELMTSAPSSMKIKVVAPPRELVVGMFPSADVDLEGRVRCFWPSSVHVFFCLVLVYMTFTLFFFSLVTLHCQPSTCCRSKK